MNSYLKGLLFAVIGGIIVLMVENTLFSPPKDYESRLVAKHRKVKITSGEAIVNTFAKKAILGTLKKENCEKIDNKACRDLYKKILKQINYYEHFDNRLYTKVHELTIQNNTDFVVSNIAIEHSFAYDAFIYFEENNKNFHTLESNDVFKINEIRPGKNIEVTLFSKAGYSDSTDNISITESGRKIPILPLYGDSGYEGIYDDELEWLFNSITQNPLLWYFIFVISIISFVLFLSIIILSIWSSFYPDASARFQAKSMSEKSYVWNKLSNKYYKQFKEEKNRR